MRAVVSDLAQLTISSMMIIVLVSSSITTPCKVARLFHLLSMAWMIAMNVAGLLTLTAQKALHWVVTKIGPDGFCLIPDSVKIWSRFGPDPVQIEVHPGPHQKIWTACPDILSRFWTKSRPVQIAFSHNPCFLAKAAPLVVSLQPRPPSQIILGDRPRE
jgi:hypothetical protein